MTGSVPDSKLTGWMPIIAPLSIWCVHFFVAYGAAQVWPQGRVAHVVGWVATAVALSALAVLFVRLRAAKPTGELTVFARRFGLGSTGIAAAGTVFDALPALLA